MGTGALRVPKRRRRATRAHGRRPGPRCERPPDDEARRYLDARATWWLDATASPEWAAFAASEDAARRPRPTPTSAAGRGTGPGTNRRARRTSRDPVSRKGNEERNPRPGLGEIPTRTQRSPPRSRRFWNGLLEHHVLRYTLSSSPTKPARSRLHRPHARVRRRLRNSLRVDHESGDAKRKMRTCLRRASRWWRGPGSTGWSGPRGRAGGPEGEPERRRCSRMSPDGCVQPGDREYSETLRGVLDPAISPRSGWATGARRAGAMKIVARDFSTFGASALPGLGSCPAGHRCRPPIPIRLKRRVNVERRSSGCASVRSDRSPRRWRETLAQWADEPTIEALAEAEPELPQLISDRAVDCWEPLIAIADLARRPVARAGARRSPSDLGGARPRRGHYSASVYSPTAARRSITQTACEPGTCSSTGTCRGGRLGGSVRASRSRPGRSPTCCAAPTEIRAKKIRVGDGTARGDPREAFEDAWSRDPRRGPAPRMSISQKIGL